MRMSRRWVAGITLATSLGAQTPPPPPPLPEPPSFWPERRAHAGGPWRREERVEPLSFGAKLWIRNRNGDIRVEGWDREEVSLSATIRDSERRRVSLVVRRKGTDLEIEAQYQQPTWTFSFGFVTSPLCDLVLKVPRKVLGYYTTRNGSVFVGNVEGYSRCETANGDIRLRDLRGEVWVDTSNGTIEARRLKARIKGSTTVGRILLEDVEGGIELSATTGEIRATNLEGWGEGISLSTTIGRISVELGRATGELMASNTSGSVDVRLPGAQVLESGKHLVRVRIPGRTQRITLETTNGGIQVRQ
jgi:DUF4097 and DUF4098 domain-containing protein YvlB